MYISKTKKVADGASTLFSFKFSKEKRIKGFSVNFGHYFTDEAQTVRIMAGPNAGINAIAANWYAQPGIVMMDQWYTVLHENDNTGVTDLINLNRVEYDLYQYEIKSDEFYVSIANDIGADMYCLVVLIYGN